jgi:hypothetical protein
MPPETRRAVYRDRAGRAAADASVRDVPAVLVWGAAYALAVVVAVPWRALAWVWVQASALVRNSIAYWTGFAFDDILPPSVRSTINFIIEMVPRAFGLREATRREQINANAVLIGVSFLSGFVTGFTTWLLIALWGSLLLFAWFFRGTPAGESLWVRVRRRIPVRDDYDLILWRSE